MRLNGSFWFGHSSYYILSHLRIVGRWLFDAYASNREEKATDELSEAAAIRWGCGVCMCMGREDILVGMEQKTVQWEEALKILQTKLAMVGETARCLFVNFLLLSSLLPLYVSFDNTPKLLCLANTPAAHIADSYGLVQ